MDGLRQVLERTRAAGLKIKPSKCHLLQERVAFLGHVISQAGVECDPEKIRAVKVMKPPETVTEVRAFLGFVGYYRRFIQDFAGMAAPLHHLLKNQLL